MAGGVPAGRLSIEIVAEIARLQQDLDKAKRAVKSASKDIENSVGAANDNFGRMTKMSGNAAFAMRNLGFQVQDVITQLSLGQSPMKVFAAQGFQIADALGQMRREAAASGQSMAGMIAGSFGRLGPVLLVAAAGAAALGAALKIVQDDLNETGNATLSYSDVALGAFDAVRAYTIEKLGPAFEWLADTVGQVWGYIADVAKVQANVMIGVMIAVPNTIYAAFTTLPQAIAELFVNMANGAIKAIEDLVNKAVKGLNSFSGMVNSLLGTSIGGVGTVLFGRIENNFAGAGKRAGIALARGVASGYGDHVGAAIDAVRPFAEARRVKRLAGDAEKAGKSAGAKGGRAAGQAMADEWLEELSKDLSQNMAAFSRDLDKIVDDLMKASDTDFDKLLDEIRSKTPKIVTDTERWANQLERTVGYLQQMGGAAGAIGQIGAIYQGLAFGDFSRVGGSIGSFLGQLNETEAGKGFLTKFRGTLDDFFGGAGKFTEALGAFGLAVSANQLIGDIFGFKGGPLGVLTDLIGSVMPAKKGRATFSGGLDYAITGNSAKRKDAVGGIGGSVVDSLRSIADALGVDLGGFTGTVAIRKNSLRYDPTGSGITRLSKGAIDFGQDEAALVAAVIADAISDGAFQGLSEGFKNYLTSGDVEKRLQDVLNLKDVMKEASSLRDPQGFALGELDKWREQMVAIATATGEGMADVEYVFAQRRKDILAQFTEDASEIESQRRTLEIALLAATGKEAEALAAARAMELESLPASIRALQESVWAAQDAAQAENELAAARAATASEARSNFETTQRLQAEIFRLQGQEAQAVKIERQLEIDAMQESLRPMLLRKYALQDEASAASEAAAAAAEVAASLAAISRERDGLMRQLMTLAGDKAGLRGMDLAALAPANRELQKAIWAVEDIAAAADATVNANNALISSYNSQINAVESLAQRYAGFANDIRAFATSLTGGGTAGAGARFDKIAAMARLGDENALSAFTGAAGGYLESARNSAGSYREYQSALIKVLGASGAAAMGADSMSREATAQIAAIHESIAQLEVANTIAQSEAENAAKRFLEEFKALQDLDLVQTDTLDAVNEQTDVLSEKLDQQTAAQNNLISAINALRAEMQAREEPMVISLGRIESVLRNVEEGGTIRVSGTTDLPVYTSAAP